ncbi:nucleolar protein 56-like [Thalictrum thalictroides]|uniref:Nucleolar protein 56-like n=1 Tax=Thalictrum thalictroides TaxID=46969 RepID=A0A7J6V2P7_THATH|nr:nucleolar protein 56-like [Thalictrum thalictroides]
MVMVAALYGDWKRKQRIKNGILLTVFSSQCQEVLVVKLEAFQPFSSALDALIQQNVISEGLMTDELRNFLELNLPNIKEGKKPYQLFFFQKDEENRQRG